jgi:hypothetical protein
MRTGPLLLIALLACACANQSSPTAITGTSIDTLDYVVGDPDLWPRTGSQWQQQTLDTARREVCWIKYFNPRTFECWRWDEDWIYHRVDQALDGDTGESYVFTDGRWMPRHLSAAWSLDVNGNALRWFDRNCRLDPVKSRPAPYRVAVAIAPSQFLSRDLGFRDVIELSYSPDPDTSGGYTEHFYFARGAGWYAWDNGRTAVRFDRLSNARLPGHGSSCGE